MKDIEIIRTVGGVDEVRLLPKGAVVGDLVGGRSFNDNVAAALERRSDRGWQDASEGRQTWTVITVDH